MKRFVFSLETVYGYKQTIEKNRRNELKQAQAALAVLREEEHRLQQVFIRNQSELDAVLEGGKGIAEELPKYSAYFRYLKELKDDLEKRIAAAEAEKLRRQNLLIQAMREVKTYAKIKEEKYQEYLVEAAREEQKEMSDIVSFKAISEQA